MRPSKMIEKKKFPAPTVVKIKIIIIIIKIKIATEMEKFSSLEKATTTTSKGKKTTLSSTESIKLKDFKEIQWRGREG